MMYVVTVLFYPFEGVVIKMKVTSKLFICLHTILMVFLKRTFQINGIIDKMLKTDDAEHFILLVNI